MTQFTADPNIIPTKFIDRTTGAMNVQALIQSAGELGINTAEFVNAQGQIDINPLAIAYREKEAARSATPAPAPAPAATSPAVINTTVPEKPAQVDWSQMQLDPQGNLPPAMRQQLLSAGIPGEQIDSFIAGQRAQLELSLVKLHSVLPNGLADYNAVINWANQNLQVQDKEKMREALAGPGGDMALLGYYQQYAAANPAATMPQSQGQGGEPNLSTVDTTGGSGVLHSQGEVIPFGNQAERHAAFAHPRYKIDRVYREEVQERARATSAAVAELQATNPSKNWTPPGRRINHNKRS